MIFTQKKQLGISWIQGEFSAFLHEKNPRNTQSFSISHIHDLAEFQSTLTQAILALGAKGADVSIVYEGNALSHSSIATPPLSNQDLSLYVANRAEQEKINDKPIIFSFKKSLKQQHQEAVILHIIEKEFVDKLIQICQQSHIFPVKLIPLSEIMNLKAFRFKPEPEEVILIIALFESVTEMLVTRGDKTILFLRDLNHSAIHGRPDHLATEIKRSMLYTNQQFNIQVKKIGLIGLNSSTLAAELQPSFDINIDCVRTDVDRSFWAKEAALLSPAIESNILPIQFQLERTSLWVKKVISYSILLAFLLALGLTIQAELIIKQQTKEIHALNQKFQAQLSERSTLSDQILEYQSLDKRFLELKVTHSYPTGAWFFAMFSSIVPPNLSLIESEIKQQDKHWNFHLKGVFLGEASLAPKQLSQLENNILSLPASIYITQSWESTWLHNIEKGSSLSQGIPFEIRGNIR